MTESVEGEKRPQGIRMPLVSVMMPVYNREALVVESVESVLAQKMTDFELLIMDDGSTDQSHRIVQRFAEKDKRVKVFKQKNSGWVNAVNGLVKKASGKYIANLDSDDIYHPERLSWAIQDFDRDSSIVASFCLARKINMKGEEILDPLLPRYLSDVYGPDIAKMLVVSNCLCMSSAVIKHSALTQNEPFLRPFSWVSDWDLWLRLATVGNFIRRKEFGVSWRQHPGNMSNEGYIQMLSYTLDVQNEHADKVMQHYGLGQDTMIKLLTTRAANQIFLGRITDASETLKLKASLIDLSARECEIVGEANLQRFDPGINLDMMNILLKNHNESLRL